MIVASIKQRLHREICANPVLHGLVLNLYLNGEQYPHHVDDYFPIGAAPSAELAALMRKHVEDEDRHALMYRKAIVKLGQPVLRLTGHDVYNHVIRSHTRASFALAETDGRDERARKLAHFFAHLHYLEKRVARSLEIHAEACAHSPSGYVRKVVARVLEDEGRHVVYTRAAVTDLVPARVASRVLAEHARAERAANLAFSSRQLEKLLTSHAMDFSGFGRWVYRLSASYLQEAHKYA
jgi:hypothetical protein